MASTDKGRQMYRDRHPKAEQPNREQEDQAEQLAATAYGRGVLAARERRGGTTGRAARQARQRWADQHDGDGPAAA